MLGSKTVAASPISLDTLVVGIARYRRLSKDLRKIFSTNDFMIVGKICLHRAVASRAI